MKDVSVINSAGSDLSLMKLYYSSAKPGKLKYREHHHTEFEMAMFKSGSGIYTVGDRKYTINPGDIFLFNSNEVHCITEVTGSEELKIVNIHFEPRFIWSVGNDLFDAQYLKIFIDRSENFQHRLDRNNPATKQIRKVFENIETEFCEKRPEYQLMVKINLLTILVLVCRNYEYVNPNDDYFVYRKNFADIEKSIEYITLNLENRITLSDIAASANMSKAYFSTVFKKLNGISPWDYITTKRIELAKEKLKSTNDTVLEIACKCGFNNTANFNRAFRKITGKVPKDYRK